MDYQSRFLMSEEDENRFIKYFTIPKDPIQCWEWTGKLNRGGYGEFYVHKKHRTASRVMYINYIGPLKSPKEFVCHKCDNPKCINPTHLFKGSNQDNMLDCVKKNRHPLASRSHCIRGHKYTEENTRIGYRITNGRVRPERVCRECQKLRRSTKL